jgi:hypothetical protein
MPQQMGLARAHFTPLAQPHPILGLPDIAPTQRHRTIVVNNRTAF